MEDNIRRDIATLQRTIDTFDSLLADSNFDNYNDAFSHYGEIFESLIFLMTKVMTSPLSNDDIDVDLVVLNVEKHEKVDELYAAWDKVFMKFIDLE